MGEQEARAQIPSGKEENQASVAAASSCASQPRSSGLRGRRPSPQQTTGFCSAGAREGSSCFKQVTSPLLLLKFLKKRKKGICWHLNSSEEWLAPPRNGALLFTAPFCRASDVTGPVQRRLPNPSFLAFRGLEDGGIATAKQTPGLKKGEGPRRGRTAADFSQGDGTGGRRKRWEI